MFSASQSIAVPLILSACLFPARAQSIGDTNPNPSAFSLRDADSSSLARPDTPSASLPSGADQPWEVAPAATTHQQPFSRVGIGANVSPLGVGIESAIVLTEYFDARGIGNFFNYNSSQFEVEGFRGNADLHLASGAASLDWYPFNSVWRLSPGLMFFNGNQISMTAQIAPGTSFKLNGQTFYGPTPNAATGVTPLKGTGVLGLHRNEPEFTLAGGFGKFVPRSNRHWSFPAEFGVIFMGAPTANVKTSGWVCQDQAQTQCNNLANSADPVTAQFNSALQAQLTKWRKDLSTVEVYPIFSYSVVYSFNIR